MQLRSARIRFSFAAAALLLSALATNAMASSVVQLDLETLSARADRVVVGHVEKMQSHFLAPGSQRIVTDVTLVVEQPVLGDPAATRFVVRHLGGEVGKVGQWVSGEASYHVGERLVLFAAERQGAFFAVGMAQGVLPIRDDAAAGVARVKSPRRASAAVSDGTSEMRSVDDLVDEVRTLVARKGTK
jgi:hypothetical protein